mgnify:CR=1 FL=1
MALRTFETDDAVYHLGLGNHATSSEPIFRNVDFKDLDFFVFEDSGERDEYRCPNLKKFLKQHDQYKGVYQRIEKENPDLAIYGVDIKTSIIGSHTSLFGALALGIYTGIDSMVDGDVIGTLEGALLTVPLLNSLLNGRCSERGYDTIRRLYNIWANLLPINAYYRDGVIAKKTAEFLVPRHKRDNKKVRAGLLFGAAHSGIETKIKHPKIADITVYLHHNLLKNNTKKDLNEVREIVRDEQGNLRTICHDCDLF